MIGWNAWVASVISNPLPVQNANGPTSKPSYIDLVRGDYMHGQYTGGQYKIINQAGTDIWGLTGVPAPEYIWSLDMLANGHWNLYISTGHSNWSYIYIDWWVDHSTQVKYALYRKHWHASYDPPSNTITGTHHSGNAHHTGHNTPSWPSGVSGGSWDTVNPWPVPTHKSHEQHHHHPHKWKLL